MSHPEEPPTDVTAEKRKATMKAILENFRRVQKEILDARNGEPLPDCVPLIDELRNGE